MIKQISSLTKLQLKNLFGMNVFRFTKDKKEKRKKLVMMVVYLVLVVTACFYIGAMTFGYVFMGMKEIVPAYLIMLSSLIILFFSIFKAGSVIFQKNAYDILTSLPLRQNAIVISRFIRMYVENVILTLVIMVPAMAVYGILVKPEIAFYIIGLIVALFIPLLPITISVFLGALITALSSRMKHKSLVSAVLSIVLILGIMLGTSQLTVMEEEFTIEMLQNLSEIVLGIIGKIYPPALWLSSAMLTGDFLLCIWCVAGGLLLLGIVIAVVSANYQWISRGLYSTNAKHNYQMERLKKTSVLDALYRREVKRYFSSSIYVTNTIVGPILAMVFSIVLLVMGTDGLQMVLELPLDIKGAVPFLLAGIFCMMPTTCTSISMEGKEWWILKSLPVKTKDVLDGKILLNLSLVLPFFIISEILLAIALKYTFLEMIWGIIIPVVMILFSSVFGITVNLKMPVFNWENEVTVVKQSASAFVGGICGFLIVLVCMVPVLFVPEAYANLMKLVICVLVVGVTLLLYCKNVGFRMTFLYFYFW